MRRNVFSIVVLSAFIASDALLFAWQPPAPQGQGGQGAGAQGGQGPGGGRRGGGRAGGPGGFGGRGGPQPASATAAQDPSKPKEPSLPAKWIDTLKWRSIGPANMSGRITALTVYEKDPSQWWAASASGGLLKTVNNGVTFEHQFDKEATISIGDVKVFQGDPNILWVGTGEANPRNSASWGDGVYKSTDGGKTWKNMGLKKTAHTGRIALHPTDANIAYVGALGRLWGANEDRGLYKTTDGGANWEKILYVDDNTGIIDVQMHPNNPEVLLAATYVRRRDAFDGNDPAVKFGAGAGIFRTVDGGKTWERLIQGLPSAELGRIGLNFSKQDPNVVMAVVESKRIGNWPKDAASGGLRGVDADAGAKLTEITKEGPAEKAGLKVDDIVLQFEDRPVLSYNQLQEQLRKVPAGKKVKVKVSRNRELIEVELEPTLRPELLEIEQRKRDPNAKLSDPDETEDRRGSPYAQSLGGQIPNLQDQQGTEGNEFGGIYISRDMGSQWERINTLNPRPMYYSQIRIDPSDQNKIWVLGTELYKSLDGGKKFTSDGHGDEVHVDHHALWIDPRDGRHVILGNDGGIYVTYDAGKTWDHHNHVAIGQFYHVGVSANRNYRVYGGLQDNGSWGGPSRVSNNDGPVNTDWMNIGGGDGFVCLVDPTDPDQLYSESQNGAMGRLNLRTGERGFMRPRVPEGKEYRFNWKTPFILSSHNPEIYYAGGNHVFKSVRKGDNIKEISPELTRDKKGSGSALAESPMDERVLYAGTTDGMLWVTKDGGTSWIDLWDDAEKLAPKKEPAKEATPSGKPTAEAKPDAKPADAKPVEAKPVEAKPVEADAKAEAKPADVKGPEAEPAKEEKSPEEKASEQTDVTIADRVIGYWEGQFTGGPMPPQRARFQLIFKLKENKKLGGNFRSSQTDGELVEIEFDATTGQLSATAETSGANMKFSGKVNDESMEGTMDVGGGRFQMQFSAKRTSKSPSEPKPDEKLDGKALKELLPKKLWISSLTASRVAEGRCYVTVDGHRADDYKPYVLMTENFGRTWKRLSDTLPETAGCAWVIREDIVNADILWLGTEFGAWVSIDRGDTWTRLNANLPNVAIHELAQHPSSGELIAGTHGRSIWILDVTPIRQMTAARVKETAYLYQPNELVRWRRMPEQGSSGTRRFVGENPSAEAQIYYALSANAADVRVEIYDVLGKRIANLGGASQAGFHKLTWNLRRQVGTTPAGGGGRGFGGGAGRGGQPVAANGVYKVVLVVDENPVMNQTLSIVADPEQASDSAAVENESLFFEALFADELEEDERESDEEE